MPNQQQKHHHRRRSGGAVLPFGYPTTIPLRWRTTRWRRSRCACVGLGRREDTTLEMRIKITPPFTNFSLTSRDNQGLGLSTFVLKDADRANGVVRLVDLVIVLDGARSRERA